jgi:hypothetical protein
MLEWLQKQDSGTYAVEFTTASGRQHVVTWRAAAAGESSILETDPAYPHPFCVSDASLKTLGIQKNTMNRIFEIKTCNT